MDAVAADAGIFAGADGFLGGDVLSEYVGLDHRSGFWVLAGGVGPCCDDLDRVAIEERRASVE